MKKSSGTLASAAKREEKKLVDEYLDYHRELVKQYGEYSVVLLQNGSFFEIYNYRMSDGPDLYKLADLLNIQVSRRDKKDLEINQKNYEMAGFPTWAKQKFVQMLLNANYTVAIYVQVEGDKGKITRVLDEIISPSTNIDYLSGADNNYLMSVFLETHTTQRKRGYTCGYSLIDLSVGRSIVHESGSQLNDFEYGLDKIYEAIKSFNPSEVVIYLTDRDEVLKRDHIYQHLELDIDNRTVHFYHNMLGVDYTRLSFQNEFLARVFPKHGMLTPIEYLDLERYPNAIISYLLLLEFAKSHRANIIEKIGKPEFIETRDQLVLTLNSIYQLGLVPDKNMEQRKTNSLVGILNNCSTAIGKRLFRHKFLHPVTSRELLEASYDQVEMLIQNDRYAKIEPILHKVLDLERMHRRLSLRILAPTEFYGLHKSYLAVRECQITLERLDCGELAMASDEFDVFKDYMDYYLSVIDVNTVYRYTAVGIERSIFVRGQYPDVDQLELQISELEDRQQNFTRQLSRLIEGQENMISLDQNDKEGYFMTLTNKRASILKDRLKKRWTFVYKGDSLQFGVDDFVFKAGANATKVFHKLGLKRWGEEMTLLRQQMCRLCRQYYLEVLGIMEERYFKTMRKVVKFIGELDVVKTNAKNAVIYCLVRPELDAASSGDSYLHIDGVRHLIVEQIQPNVPFVTNDVRLGNGHPWNILCYGYNAVGKTTLQKSLAMSIVCAQSGGFVAASAMRFRPFRQLFTRISNVDNLLKGQSSYMVEMLELKYILKHANRHSLVCIDELVASTESYSGISSVVATLKMLHDRGSCMFMATHLHQLAKMNRVTQLAGLTIKHLEVFYDQNHQTLVYDRKLKDGPGSGLYGLEVSRYLDLPKEFLDLAFEVRNELLSTDGESGIVTHKASRYNSDINVDHCAICKAKPGSKYGQDPVQLDVHHINFQCHADTHGNINNSENIGSFHKNVAHNLVVVCKSCHHAIHAEQIVLKGYIFTGDGIKLDYTGGVASSHLLLKEAGGSEGFAQTLSKAPQVPGSSPRGKALESSQLCPLKEAAGVSKGTACPLQEAAGGSKGGCEASACPLQQRKSKYSESQKTEMREFLTSLGKGLNKRHLIDQLHDKTGHKISYQLLNQLLA